MDKKDQKQLINNFSKYFRSAEDLRKGKQVKAFPLSYTQEERQWTEAVYMLINNITNFEKELLIYRYIYKRSVTITAIDLNCCEAEVTRGIKKILYLFAGIAYGKTLLKVTSS